MAALKMTLLPLLLVRCVHEMQVAARQQAAEEGEGALQTPLPDELVSWALRWALRRRYRKCHLDEMSWVRRLNQ